MVEVPFLDFTARTSMLQFSKDGDSHAKIDFKTALICQRYVGLYHYVTEHRLRLGGFKLTREYAGFVNKQQPYHPHYSLHLNRNYFAATLLIDMVIFNTMDFWEGRVSAGSYEFKDGNKFYQAHHEIVPNTGLKRSTIRVMDEIKSNCKKWC